MECLLDVMRFFAICVLFGCLTDRQEYYVQEGRHGYGSRASKGPSTVNKVREALNLMRNQKFEVRLLY